jgi:glycerol-3-phosphate dehydrogenase (NAD(P)+)
MKRIALLGLGNWGTALAEHLARQGMSVFAWTREAEIVESINEAQRNPVFLNHIALSPGIRASTCLEEVCQWEAEFLLVVLPSGALELVFPQIQALSARGIVSAVKGFCGSTGLTPLQFIKGYFPELPSAVVSGPSFASDVIEGKPAGLVSASTSASFAKSVAEIFSAKTMKVYHSSDPMGVELGGIVKNVIALAAGVCDGLDLGDSARAGLVTRGVAEIARFTAALGGQEQTVFGLSGLGDLIMTATCDQSRNRQVGLRLGRGESLESILHSLGSVAEGVRTAPFVCSLAREHGVEMPIAFAVERLLMGSSSPEELVQALIQRPIKKEFE